MPFTNTICQQFLGKKNPCHENFQGWKPGEGDCPGAIFCRYRPEALVEFTLPLQTSTPEPGATPIPEPTEEPTEELTEESISHLVETRI